VVPLEYLVITSELLKCLVTMKVSWGRIFSASATIHQGS